MKADNVIPIMNWIFKIIYSCKTPIHLESAENLVELFYKRYPYLTKGENNVFEIIIQQQRTRLHYYDSI